MPTTVPVLVDFWRSADHPGIQLGIVWSQLCRGYDMPESANAFDARQPGSGLNAPPVFRWERDDTAGVIRGGPYLSTDL